MTLHDMSCVCNECIIDANMMCTCTVEGGPHGKLEKEEDYLDESRFDGEFCKECGGCYPQR